MENIDMNMKENNTYKDDRGEIQMILESCDVGSISRIITEPGKTRARHTHPNDTHFIIVNYGQIIIYERPTGTNDVPIKTVLNKGDIHFTKNKTDHLMVFLVKTEFDCYSLLPRNSDNYEKETIRLSKEQDNLIESYNKYWETNEKAV